MKQVVTQEAIETAKEGLNMLAKAPNFSNPRDVVEGLKEQILAARNSGRTWLEIRLVLEQSGIKISTPTLSNLMGVHKNKGKKA